MKVTHIESTDKELLAALIPKKTLALIRKKPKASESSKKKAKKPKAKAKSAALSAMHKR